MQQKLLTVIEKRETQRIGSNKVSHVDVRILAATNAHLREKVGEGSIPAGPLLSLEYHRTLIFHRCVIVERISVCWQNIS